MSQQSASLTLSGVSKHFGGAQALTDIDVAFERGKIHSLIGENGAGKSTPGVSLLLAESLPAQTLPGGYRRASPWCPNRAATRG
jgi:ABC-type branched-subunit amino acid transport system ATPase component